VAKERVILSDEEFAQFVGCAEVDLELRVLAMVAQKRSMLLGHIAALLCSSPITKLPKKLRI
jgi:hypothetical protein